MDEFSASCSKTMMVCGVPAFKKGIFYGWHWSNAEEIEDGFGEYCFRSELCERHFLSLGDLEEFFA